MAAAKGVQVKMKQRKGNLLSTKRQVSYSINSIKQKSSCIMYMFPFLQSSRIAKSHDNGDGLSLQLDHIKVNITQGN